MSVRTRSKLALFAALLGCCSVGPAGLAQEPATAADAYAALQAQVGKMLEKHGGAVVRVEATDSHGQLSGSGFFIDPTGLLYTTYSVGGDTHSIVVVMGDLKYPAKRLAADERCGVALLQVEAKTPFLMLGNSRELTVASPVVTLGYPMDLPLTPSFGIIGGFDRKYLGRFFATTHLRANVAVQRGQAGAPLLNMRGEAVGILISGVDQGSASFVLPIEAAEKVRKDYMRFGEVRPGWLGLSLVASKESHSGSTAQVEEVFAHGPADRAGLKPHDVLLNVAGRDISSPEDMLDACFFLSAEDQVTVVALRGDQPMEFRVETVDPPSRKQSQPALSLSEDPAPAPVPIAE